MLGNVVFWVDALKQKKLDNLKGWGNGNEIKQNSIVDNVKIPY